MIWAATSKLWCKWQMILRLERGLSFTRTRLGKQAAASMTAMVCQLWVSQVRKTARQSLRPETEVLTRAGCTLVVTCLS